jgi:hypothetical protein
MDYAAQAMYYVAGEVDRGVNVAAVNCSWGTSNSGGLDAAAANLLAHDVMIIHAAGNAGNTTADYFGGLAGIMNVGATDSLGAVASWSSYGTWVDIAAPGVDILSTWHEPTDPSYDYISILSGTSMATPHCCGVAALLESRNSALTGPQKFNLMINHTTPYTGSHYVGTGIVNAKLALDYASPCTDVLPPSVTVTSPNGGENWTTGTAHAITWTGTDDCSITQTEIRIDRTNDGTFEERIALLTGNPGTYSWTVTSATGTNEKIQVICTDGASHTGSDASNAVFTVSAPTTPGMHVDNIVVTRVYASRKYNGRAVVTVKDQTNAVVYNARVYGYFNSPTTASKNAYTNTSGVATISGDKTSYPPTNWCFTVTSITKSGSTYVPTANLVTQACETGWVYELGSAVPNRAPDRITLEQNRPNPFNSTTEFEFALPEESQVRLDVYDMLGHKVASLVNETLGAGTYGIQWDAKNDFGSRLPSGIYLYRLTAGEVGITKRLILVE